MSRLAAVVAALAVAGCTTPHAVGKTSQLRDKGSGGKSGICASDTAGMFVKVTTCVRTGFPGTLDDDGVTPVLQVAVAGPANSPSADIGNWQVEGWKNGRPFTKQRFRNRVPELNCVVLPCSSWSIAGVEMEAAWGPGTYVFKYTCTFDTSMVATNTITIAP